ncbi:alginate export family protein [Asticcacaulis tiandongensis]|uniref:alginate export family protein n=1 Tax=Asticcacaulis tiandongensis TaxID=2565365 RepID=UPI00112E1B4A|nr:alginate export family protein [Asticcacaulis tiandongensis]
MVRGRRRPSITAGGCRCRAKRGGVTRRSGQFRAGGTGGDQLLAFRTLIKAQATRGAWIFVGEMQDSRSYLGDAGTAYSTSWVNPVDVLQAYGEVAVEDLPGQATTAIQMGRMTLDIGSRRQVERVEFANVIFNYTGVHIRSKTRGGAQWHALYAVPVTRLPAGRAALSDNDISGDEEATNRKLWGLHYIRPNSFKHLAPGLTAEAFVCGLDERDSNDNPTPNRHYTTPGFRISRPPKVGQWDVDVEAAWRYGTRRSSSNTTDVRDLKVRAWTLHAHWGRTLDLKWQPRLVVDYDYASGDKNPIDGRYDQYERLFGSRRTDLGNTGIHGPLTPANINAPGFRIEVRPNARTDARFAYKAAYLASKADSWVVAGVRDSQGRSGSFIGHSIDSRMRYWFKPKHLLGEVGVSLLLDGEVGRNAPTGSRQGDTAFGYVQLTGYF